jgi:hypothetical protein
MAAHQLNGDTKDPLLSGNGYNAVGASDDGVAGRYGDLSYDSLPTGVCRRCLTPSRYLW